jgi:transposase-like protein
MAARLTDKQKKKIIADYVELGSYNAVAKKHGIADITVKRIVLQNGETLKKVEQKKEENTIDLMNYLDSKKVIVCEILDKGLTVLNDKEKLMAANPAQITTALGTLIDKFVSVAPQKATSNEIYRIDPLVIADGFASVRRDILNYRHTEYCRHKCEKSTF